MKHERAERMLAVVLAAVLLAGCGAASSQMTREEGSIAGPPVKTESALPVSTPGADTAPEPENGTETPQELPPLDQRVTNQWEIHKNLQDPAGKVLCLNMEVPRINSASADAARINAGILPALLKDLIRLTSDPLLCIGGVQPHPLQHLGGGKLLAAGKVEAESLPFLAAVGAEIDIHHQTQTVAVPVLVVADAAYLIPGGAVFQRRILQTGLAGFHIAQGKL